MVGQTLGHYRLDNELGTGGMGVAYGATDLVLGRRAAIKVLRPEILRDPDAKARFLREARAIAALNHPGIATLYEIGESDGLPYLVMEYVEGKTVKEILLAGPLSEPQLLNYAAQIAASLEHARSRSILHRDIKSSNIILTREGRIKLLDFGLAKALDPGDQTHTKETLTAPGTWMGTLHYAAPEVLSGQPADFRSDIYSFGVVLYEMGCGRLPFAGLTASAVVSAILHSETPPVQQRNPTLSPGLCGVIERAMARRPEDRFATGAEVLEVLEHLEKGVPAGQPQEPAAGAPVVGVLEFQNLSKDPAVDWLGMGIAETLTSDLKRLKKIRVASRERMQAALRGPLGEVSPTELGQQLGLAWLVTGSYQRAGDRVRITPRLLDVARGEEIAAGKVDGHWEDLFALQDRVVTNLTEALELNLGDTALERIAAPDTLHLKAYEHYAQGRKRFYELGKTSLEEARQEFERALALDSRYAVAHAALGSVYAMRFIHRTDPDDLTRAVAHAERARALDPELGEPYPWLCYAYMRQGKLDQAIAAGHKGVEHQPDLVQAPYFLGAAYLIGIEVHPEYYQPATHYFLAATRVEPRWEASWLCLAWIALMAGDYDRVEQFASGALELARKGEAWGRFVGVETILGDVSVRRLQWEKARHDYLAALETLAATDHMYRDQFMALSSCGLGELELRQGSSEAALAALRRAWRGVQEYPRMLGRERVAARTLAGMAWAYAAQGERQRAEQLARDAAERLDQISKQPETFIWEGGISQLYHALGAAQLHTGEVDTALGLLEKAVDTGWRDARWLEVDPAMSSLAGQPRFRSLVERLRQLPAIRFEPATTIAAP